MIFPNVRASFGRDEAARIVRTLSDGDAGRAREWEAVLAERGLDPLLDEPSLPTLLMGGGTIEELPLGLVLYVVVRRALLESGVDSRVIADYLAALVLEFGFHGRSHRISEQDDREYRYLVDILADMSTARGRRAFLLQAHLGNFALWLSGLFPDHITSRVHRRGGPDLAYYEELGRAAYRMAADDPMARRESMDELYRDAAEAFVELRRGLNRVSDRYLLPHRGPSVDRLLRQVRDGFEERRA